MTESILVAKDLKEYALSISHSKFNGQLNFNLL